MKVTVHEITVQEFSLMLGNLKGLLKKAQGFAEEKKIDLSVLLQMRLAPDMFPLGRQIQIAADVAKMTAARMSGKEAPKFEDNEQTYEQFMHRLDQTLNYLKAFKAEDFENFEKTEVRFPWRPGFHIKGRDYVVQYALPNFYFHVSAAYAILRHAGLPIGKGDYLGPINWQEG